MNGICAERRRTNDLPWGIDTRDSLNVNSACLRPKQREREQNLHNPPSLITIGSLSLLLPNCFAPLSLLYYNEISFYSLIRDSLAACDRLNSHNVIDIAAFEQLQQLADRQMPFLLSLSLTRSLGFYLAEDNLNDPHLMALTIYYAESSEQLTSSHEIEDSGMSPKENDG